VGAGGFFFFLPPALLGFFALDFMWNNAAALVQHSVTQSLAHSLTHSLSTMLARDEQ
jgi:hypothetical protein